MRMFIKYFVIEGFQKIRQSSFPFPPPPIFPFGGSFFWAFAGFFASVFRDIVLFPLVTSSYLVGSLDGFSAPFEVTISKSSVKS